MSQNVIKEYHLHDGKEEIGIFSFEEIILRHLVPTDYIWYDGLDDWTPIVQIDELKQFIQTDKIRSSINEKNKEIKRALIDKNSHLGKYKTLYQTIFWGVILVVFIQHRYHFLDRYLNASMQKSKNKAKELYLEQATVWEANEATIGRYINTYDVSYDSLVYCNDIASRLLDTNLLILDSIKKIVCFDVDLLNLALIMEKYNKVKRDYCQLRLKGLKEKTRKYDAQIAIYWDELNHAAKEVDSFNKKFPVN